MNVKKTGFWGAGILGSFIVMLALVYFLFPWLNPKKAARVADQQQPKMKKAVVSSVDYGSTDSDSLMNQMMLQKKAIDSLSRANAKKAQTIDSLKLILQKNEVSNDDHAEADQSSKKVAKTDSAAVKKASQSLLRLDEESLSPIVNLLEEHQLIGLYEKGSSRQREKLLRTLQPKKAASILKQVM